MKLNPRAFTEHGNKDELLEGRDPVPPLHASSISLAELETFAERLLVASRIKEKEIKERPTVTDNTTAVGVASNVLDTRTGVSEILAEEALPIDPVLDILLDLFVSEDAGTKVSVSDASVAGRCPMSTGIRWLKVLTEADLVRSTNDTDDQRRRFISLTPKGRVLTLRCVQAFSSASAFTAPD